MVIERGFERCGASVHSLNLVRTAGDGGMCTTVGKRQDVLCAPRLSAWMETGTNESPN
jgi:hypothetical protein